MCTCLLVLLSVVESGDRHIHIGRSRFCGRRKDKNRERMINWGKVSCKCFEDQCWFKWDELTVLQLAYLAACDVGMNPFTPGTKCTSELLHAPWKLWYQLSSLLKPACALCQNRILCSHQGRIQTGVLPGYGSFPRSKCTVHRLCRHDANNRFTSFTLQPKSADDY